MRPQTEAFLEKSRELLRRARIMIDAGLNEDAGRNAYLAGYHAAQALIFEHDGRILKTHKGVLGEFGKLIKGDARFDVELRAFLGRTFQLKAIADYETGSGAEVTAEQTAEAVEAATRFVETLSEVLASDTL